MPRILLGDRFGLAILALLVALVLVDQLRGGRSIFRTDIITVYLPWYTYLGERLRTGDIPGWMPFGFSGHPFVGDPQSGWSYLPSMLIFPFWGGVTGFKIFIGFHIALAAFSTYALARLLTIGVPGAIVAGGAYAFGGFLERTRCCSIHAQVAVWLPLAFIGVECALRAQRRSRQLLWLSLTGFCFSQMIAGWPGKGAYYGMLAIAAFATYRVFTRPRGTGLRFVGRQLIMLAVVGGAIGAIGAGLAAYGLLPRLATISNTGLSEGYDDATRTWTVAEIVDRLFSSDDRLGRWYAGAALLAVAMVTPLIVRRGQAWFWSVYGAIAVLSIFAASPLWWPAYALLPRFESLHRHYPDQALTVFYIAPAMLAGLLVDTLWRSSRRVPLIAVVAGITLVPAVALIKHEFDGEVEWYPAITMMSAVALALAIAAVRPGTGRFAAVAIGVIVLLDPTFSTAIQRIPGAEDDALHQGIVNNYTGATPVSAFLAERASAEGPIRFFGYDPGLMLSSDFDLRSYLVDGVSEHEPPALLVNNRAILLGLEDIQGYSPVQSEQYVAFIEFTNRRQQSYHFASILPWGWSSPLIDLLNVRYIVLPTEVPAGRPDLLHLSRTMPTVFQHGDQRVVVNEDALPRAWIVHEVRAVDPSRILHLLRSGREDPQAVAYVADETALPALDTGVDAVGDSVRIVSREPDRMTLEVTANGDGLVVLSEMYAEGWNATVDGKQTPVHEVDAALRGIVVPGGHHVIELTFEPPLLRIGMATSALTAASVLLVYVAMAWRERGGRSRPRRTSAA